MLEATEIREMTDADIRERIGQLEEERFRLTFRAATETLEDPLRLRVIRRDVARLKTILGEKARGEVPANGAAKADAGAKRSAAKKSSARKAAGRKPAGRKSAGRKSTGRKSAGGKTVGGKTVGGKTVG